MTIRPATAADLPALLDLVQRVVPLMQATGNFQWDNQYPNEAVFRRDLTLNQLWVAEIDGQIAGVSAITADQEPEYAQVGWDLTQPAIVTHRLAVDPAFQGKGIATALLDQAEKIATDQGITRLLIDTGAANQVTQRLFPRLGYQYAGEIRLAFRDNLRVYCYEKRLF